MIEVNRIEDGMAILEADRNRLVVPLNELPSGIREGSVLIKTADGFIIDEESEKERRRKIAAKRRRIFGK